MLAACSKRSAGGSWRWQAVGNPGSSTPSRTYVHNDPLLDSRVWGPATHCQPPPPPSPWEERETPGRKQWGLYQTAHQSVIKKLGIFLGLSRFDSFKESVTMPSLVFKCRRWSASFRSANVCFVSEQESWKRIISTWKSNRNTVTRSKPISV